MVAMSLWATNLRQITGALASQIRMEIYASAGKKMVTYYYQQKLPGSTGNEMDLTDLNAEGGDPATRERASHNIKVLGKTTHYPRVTGYSDPAQFTSGQNIVPCKLTFLKAAKKSIFLASIETQFKSDRNVVTFEFTGSLDQRLYDRPIGGTLVKVEGRWGHLIDI